MTKLIKGDTVQLKNLKKHPKEWKNWSKEDGLELSENYIVDSVSEVGWVRLEGKLFIHPPEKFKVVRRNKKAHATIEINKNSKGSYFTVKGANGKVLNHSFNSKRGCLNGIEALRRAMADFEIVDLTKPKK